MKRMAVICKRIVDGEVCVSVGFADAADRIGVSRQAVSRSVLRGVGLCAGWKVWMVPRVFLVKDLAGRYEVCKLERGGGRFKSLNQDREIPVGAVAEFRDITRDAYDIQG